MEISKRKHCATVLFCASLSDEHEELRTSVVAPRRAGPVVLASTSSACL